MGNYQQEIFNVIGTLTGQRNMLVIPREFINYTGDLETALFLSQLIYWTGKVKSDNGWVYKNYKEWEEEISLSEYQVRKARKKLEKMGILETKIAKVNGNPTVHYRLKKGTFSETFLKKLQERTCENFRNEPVKNTETIYIDPYKDNLTYTETTTETTTEINNLCGHEKNAQNSKKPDPRIKQLIDYYYQKFVSKFSEKPVINGKKDGSIFKELLKNHDEDKIKRLLDLFFESKDPFIVQNGYTIGVFKTKFNKLLVEAKQCRSGTYPGCNLPDARELYGGGSS